MLKIIMELTVPNHFRHTDLKIRIKVREKVNGKNKYTTVHKRKYRLDVLDWLRI